jgi:hypothetical protein
MLRHVVMSLAVSCPCLLLYACPLRVRLTYEQIESGGR